MRRYIPYFLILSMLCLNSCIDPIAFEVENTSRIVIFGTMTQEKRIHKVNVARSNRFGGRPVPLQGVSVRIVGDDGSTGFYEEAEKGEYLLYPDRFTVLEGHEYYIEVSLPNGKVYRSKPEMLPMPRSIDEVYFEARYRKDVSNADVIFNSARVELYINTDLQTDGRQSYLRWDVEEDWSFTDNVCGAFDNATTCYFKTSNPSVKMPIFHSEDPNQKRVEGLKIFERQPFPTIEFNFRHYFSVRQYSISPEAFRFWQQVNQVANPQGTIFDVLPAGVQGNIYNVQSENEIVLGYFELASTSVVRTYTLPKLLEPLFFELECTSFVFFNDPAKRQTCCYCNTIPGATLSRPEWWGE